MDQQKIIQIKKISLSAPILPKKGIGNIQLGMNVAHLYAMIEKDHGKIFKNWTYRFGRNGVISLFVLSYKKTIDLYFNTGLGSLGLIKLKKGYKGKLFEHTKIGSTCDKLFDYYGDKDFSVADGMLGFSTDLLFKIGEDDDYLEEAEVRPRKIEEIWLRDIDIMRWPGTSYQY